MCGSIGPTHLQDAHADAGPGPSTLQTTTPGQIVEAAALNRLLLPSVLLLLHGPLAHERGSGGIRPPPCHVAAGAAGEGGEQHGGG